MFCKNCGAEIPDDSKHCSKCGAKVVNETKEKKTSRLKKLSRKKKILLVGIIVIIIILAIVLSSGGGDNDNDDAEEFGNYLRISSQIKNNMTEAQFKSQCSVLDYGLLNKNPYKYEGDYVQYTGEVFQIQEYKDIGMLLLETDGSYNDLIYVIYTGANDYVEGDHITVYGVLDGQKSYETKGGTINTLPLMDGIYIDAA